MLNELSATLSEQNLLLEVTPEAKEKLAQLGYHPAFGARPLRRVIQEHLEDKLADYILEDPETAELIAEMNNGEIVISKK
jgi:ATP-dependent Clp protease ATP-binding subunit ClpE